MLYSVHHVFSAACIVQGVRITPVTLQQPDFFPDVRTHPL